MLASPAGTGLRSVLAGSRLIILAVEKDAVALRRGSPLCFRRFAAALLALLLVPEPGGTAVLDVDTRAPQWRDQFWLALSLSLTDTFLLRHAGYGRRDDDPRDPRHLAIPGALLQTVGHHAVYTPLVYGRFEPVHAGAQLGGIATAWGLYPRMRPVYATVESLADITERQTLTRIVYASALTLAAGYTLPRRRSPIELRAKEQIDETTWRHAGFFSYYTARSAYLLDLAGYRRYPPESLAWRVAFGVGVAKEVIFDALVGTGPSLLDTAADGAGVFAGYHLYRFYRALRDRDPHEPGVSSRFGVMPAPAGVRVVLALP